jgi:hypothetical protein
MMIAVFGRVSAEAKPVPQFDPTYFKRPGA